MSALLLVRPAGSRRLTELLSDTLDRELGHLFAAIDPPGSLEHSPQLVGEIRGRRLREVTPAICLDSLSDVADVDRYDRHVACKRLLDRIRRALAAGRQEHHVRRIEPDRNVLVVDSREGVQLGSTSPSSWRDSCLCELEPLLRAVRGAGNSTWLRAGSQPSLRLAVPLVQRPESGRDRRRSAGSRRVRGRRLAGGRRRDCATSRRCRLPDRPHVARPGRCSCAQRDRAIPPPGSPEEIVAAERDEHRSIPDRAGDPARQDSAVLHVNEVGLGRGDEAPGLFARSPR